MHVTWPSVPVPSLWIAFPFFCLFFPCLFLRCHLVAIQECLAFLRVSIRVSTFPQNSVWLFDTHLILNHSFCPMPLPNDNPFMICLPTNYYHTYSTRVFIFILSYLLSIHTDHHIYRPGTTPTSSAALSLATLSLSTSASATAASPPSSTPHGHAHSHSLGHAYPLGYGHAHGHAHPHSHAGYTTLAPKPAAGGGVNGTGNVAIISGSAPSISRMDSSRSGLSFGSATGSAGPVGIEEERDGGDERLLQIRSRLLEAG